MFTGIVQTTAQVTALEHIQNSLRVTLRPEHKLGKLKLGQSIAVDGVCLTLVKSGKAGLEFDVIPETLKLTRFGALGPGDWLNIELPLKYGDELGGHYVQGHVHGIGRVQKITRKGKDVRVWIAHPAKLSRGIALKGYITVNGVSLTVSAKKKNAFEISLIPMTLKETNLGKLELGMTVNLETDILLNQTRSGTTLGDQVR